LQKYFPVCIKGIGGVGFIIVAQIVVKLIAARELLFIFTITVQYFALFCYRKKGNVVIPIILGFGLGLAVRKLGVSVLLFILVFKSF